VLEWLGPDQCAVESGFPRVGTADMVEVLTGGLHKVVAGSGDPATEMYSFATTNSKLWGAIHKAVKQFTAYDTSHCMPWVITFASVNFQLCWNSLREAMQGGSVVDGRVMFDWTKSAEFKRWTKDRYDADLYVWLQVNQRQPYQASFVTNKQSPHRPLIDDLVTNLRALPLSDADMSFLLI
jgi:hypothetical protein